LNQTHRLGYDVGRGDERFSLVDQIIVDGLGLGVRIVGGRGEGVPRRCVDENGQVGSPNR
jgi:hypothetical protein